VGSFSTKNPRKYEVIFTTPSPSQRIAAYFNFAGIIGRHATVTFHPIITTHIQGGRIRENANRLVQFPAPHPEIFSIVVRQINLVLAPVFDTYWLPWSQDYDIIVSGVVWETLIYQEQLSRSTRLRPLHQHNLLNDGQHDVVDDNDDDEDNDDDDDDDDDNDNNDLGDGEEDFN
jgi:hypothetical protein